jgi:hypothetical protein
VTKRKSGDGPVHRITDMESNLSPAKIEEVLKLIDEDKSAPTVLRLKVGVETKLADGVFVKKRAKGILEIYTREE